MARCPYCKELFNAPYVEKPDIAELSKDTVIICCPQSNCNMFLGIIGKGAVVGGRGRSQLDYNFKTQISNFCALNGQITNICKFANLVRKLADAAAAEQ